MKFVKQAAGCIAAAFVLSGCLSTSQSQKSFAASATADSGPSQAVWFDVPKSAGQKRYLSALVSRTGGLQPSSGNLVSARFRVRDARSSGGSSERLQPLDANLTAYLTHTYGPTTSPELMFKLGQQVASQTVCQGRTLVKPTGTRYSGASAQKVYRANAGNGLNTFKVPASATGGAIPPVEYEKFGWTVNMTCR